MSLNDKNFSGSIPDIYDDYLVPMIFESYAEDLARRVADGPAEDVLETATGSGVVTRALARALPAGTRLVATDLNPPMLERARARQPKGVNVTWQPADAQDLPFGESSFDAVVCQFGVMFFPDRIKGYSEARRVLKPGGRFLFNVWDGIADNEFADAVTQAACRLIPDDPPRFLDRTPHGHGNPDRIRSELVEAGFSDVLIDRVSETSTAPGPEYPAIAYVQGTPLRGEIEPHGPDMLERVTKAATEDIRARWGDGPVSAKIQGFVVTARRDHPLA